MDDKVTSLEHTQESDCWGQPELGRTDYIPIPDYLCKTYSWAYLNPRSIWCFERDWVVNLILWGNMDRLIQAVIEKINPCSGPVLQIACVYGNFSKKLADHLLAASTDLDIVDIAPIQLQNASAKLAAYSHISLHQQDSSKLRFASSTYASTVLFFLLHEQPAEV